MARAGARRSESAMKRRSVLGQHCSHGRTVAPRQGGAPLPARLATAAADHRYAQIGCLCCRNPPDRLLAMPPASNRRSSFRAGHSGAVGSARRVGIGGFAGLPHHRPCASLSTPSAVPWLPRCGCSTVRVSPLPAPSRPTSLSTSLSTSASAARRERRCSRQMGKADGVLRRRLLLRR